MSPFRSSNSKTHDLARKISGLHADPILHERKLILDRLHGRRQLVHLRNDTRPTIGVRWYGLGSLLRSRIVNDHLDVAPEKPDRQLIYIDQWEELYAMAPPAEDASPWISSQERRLVSIPS